MILWLLPSSKKLRALLPRDSTISFRLAKQDVPVSNAVIERTVNSGNINLESRYDAYIVSKDCEFDFFLVYRSFVDLIRLEIEPEEIQTVSHDIFGWHLESLEIFKTLNPKILNGIYFPVELANRSNLDSFELSVVSSLRTLGVFKANAKEIVIRDNGGWEGINSLTAEILLEWNENGDISRARILGTALFQPISVHISVFRQSLRKRILILEEYCVPCGIVDVGYSAVISKEGLGQTTFGKEKEFFVELARICALVDSKILWVIENVQLHSEFGVLANVVEIGREDLLANALPGSSKLEDIISLTGDRPSWVDVMKTFRNIGGGWEFLQDSISGLEDHIKKIANVHFETYYEEFRDDLAKLFQPEP